MVFSSVVFLFYFLPAVLALYFLAPAPLKNFILLILSLLFYAWGEPVLVLLMLFSIVLNYAFGLAIQHGPEQSRNVTLLLGVTGNLALLGYFKYAEFLAQNIEAAFGVEGLQRSVGSVTLPLGISFFTFQAMSYLVDVYRGVAPAQRNPLRVALYIALFPQLIAGPIVRYNSICDELQDRRHSMTQFGEGLARFIIGLGKKVLIANAVARPADFVFQLPTSELTTSMAWLGIVCYSLQIYFDFSGYSDMAIGMGKMFGFTFPENFNYPYAATSIRDFWRRWHISLSTWFRDYVYIPLGGNRGSNGRTAFNLVTVFFLCGLWHGANWTFVVWGLYHGVFLAVERTRFGALLDRMPAVVRHGYVVAVFMIGWIFFRAYSLNAAFAFLKALFGMAAASTQPERYAEYVTVEVLIVMALGAILSFPVIPWIGQWLAGRATLAKRPVVLVPLAQSGLTVGLFGILVWSALRLMSDTYNPFIYFRF